MARRFDGISDLIRSDISSSFPGTGYPFTFAIKVRPGKLRSDVPLTISDKSASNVYYTIEIRVNGANLKPFIVARNTGWNGLEGTTNLSISNDTWYSIVGVLRSATNREIYVNGISEAGGSGQTSVTLSSNLDRISVGALDRSSTGNYVEGSLAEAVVCDHEWSLSEIISYSNGIPASRLRRNGWYLPILGNSSPEVDLSGNNNHGTVTGTLITAHPTVGRYAKRRHSFSFISAAPPAGSTLVQIERHYPRGLMRGLVRGVA